MRPCLLVSPQSHLVNDVATQSEVTITDMLLHDLNALANSISRLDIGALAQTVGGNSIFH